MEQDRIPEIDALRAVAMTAVVAQHCGLAPFGWTGVWLFFVISGYVISRNFMRQEYVAKSWARQYRNFMLRRFFRIVPVYVLYVTIGAVTLASLNKIGALRDLPFLLSFTHNWQMIFSFWPNPEAWSGFGHLWTLSIEEQFYVAYPLLFLLIPRRQYLTVLVILVAAGPLIRFAYSAALADTSSDGGWIAFAVYTASFAHFDSFLLGALIANFEDDIRKREWVAKLLAGGALMAAAGYAIWYVHVNRAMGAAGIDLVRNIFSGILFGQGREIFVYTVVNFLAATAVVYAILHKRVLRMLARPTILLVGRISYGGYLYHALVLWLISVIAVTPSAVAVPHRLAWFLVVWSLTVAVAYASFRWFEMPIIRWSRKPRSFAFARKAHSSGQGDVYR